ncbi:MAG: hypothetical protein GC134_04850 [Proteobacteria bacterium]|nr:hypothetical protein [Pseudomonadota bacterium]
MEPRATQTIMLISCNTADRQKLHGELMGTACTVVVSDSVLDALEKLNHTNPDLIVIDAHPDEHDFLLDALPKANSDEYIPIMVVGGTQRDAKSVDAAKVILQPYAPGMVQDSVSLLLK